MRKEELIIDCTVSDLAQVCCEAYRENGDDVDTHYASTSLARKHFRLQSSPKKVNELPSGARYIIIEPNENTANTTIADKNPRPIIIAFKGTDTNNLNDLHADWQIMVHGQARTYQKEANTAVENLVKSYPKRPIIVTGHSLGGSIAQHAVANILNNNLSCSQKPDIRAVTFGAPGMSDEMHNEIKKAGNKLHFITIEHVNDPIAGLGGVNPTNTVYKVKNDEVAHGINTYIPNSENGLPDRLTDLGNVIVSGNLRKVHHNLFQQEVERLKENDSKYASNNLITSKLWLAQIALNMMAKNELASIAHHLQECSGVMQRRRFINPASKKNVPDIETNAGVISNLPSLIKRLNTEITRMEKDDARYAQSGHETLKLALFKSLEAKLQSVNTETKITSIAPQKLKTTLNALYSLQRDENYLSIKTHSWITNKLSLVLNRESNDIYNKLMSNARNNWIKPESAKNTPQVIKNGKRTANNEIREALSKEIERMSENDYKYAKSGKITLKLMLFKLLETELHEKPSTFSVKELQDTLNAIYSMDRSNTYPSVAKNIGQIYMKSKMDLQAQTGRKVDLSHFWKSLENSSAGEIQPNVSDRQNSVQM